MTLGWKAAHAYVAREAAAGNDVYWDGWTIVKFTPNRAAFMRKAGRFRNGQWGYENRTPVNDNGKWVIRANRPR